MFSSAVDALRSLCGLGGDAVANAREATRQDRRNRIGRDDVPVSALGAADAKPISLLAEPASATLARRFARDACSACSDVLVDASLVVTSELVTNAVRHARTPLTLQITAKDDWVRVEVYDDSPQLPEPGAGSPRAQSGRGLRLVDALAATWGSRVQGDGKVVWAELTG